MRCEHCGDGLMLVDNFDADARTCSSCGRCDFRPTPEVQAEEPQPVGPIDPIRHHVHTPRGRAARPPSIREGRVASP